jgi:hypothetical protein
VTRGSLPRENKGRVCLGGVKSLTWQLRIQGTEAPTAAGWRPVCHFTNVIANPARDGAMLPLITHQLRPWWGKPVRIRR